MPSRRGNLQPAHRGYRYQDIATAYVLVRALVERYDEVIVDRKQVEDDRIDDLEVRLGGRRVRRQFKSSQDATRPLSEDDFTASGSSLRIDRLVLTHVRGAPAPGDEYRLCATWAPPSGDDPLSSRLEPVAAASTLEGWPTQCFRLRAAAIWPAGSIPNWTPLARFAAPGAEFGRAEFLVFCERFVIELALPVASTELSTPGPLERALVDELATKVGIGRYPNQGRQPADVAALAISLANLARTQEASLTPAEVEHELDIRVDFGRVAQAFPLEAALFHDRPTFRRTLLEDALAGVHQIVVAPPGAGKSWELTRLADELRTEGAIVARHYCYLEPGDNLVERRVTADVFFGNLLGELVDADPSLQGAGGSRYAAGIKELEGALAKAAESERPVVLIVDGLDHIARVRADARGLGDDETDIVERLATLKVPEGVAIVIGSQPGEHLDPLQSQWRRTLVTRSLPRWTQPELEALADLHGVSGALIAVGVDAGDDVPRVRAALAGRADGNPLYARYLARGLVAGLRDGTIASPLEWIDLVPAIAGDIAVYYRHLYGNASAQAQAVADLLGVIDFAVTEGELREMLPAFVGAWVPPALTRLAPILTSATGQGGVRVFHESFRRFMAQELARQGRSPADALAPVIDWLERRGLYRDAKAYRFLLPALRRAGRSSAVLDRVRVTFVSDSVAQAHPLDAIQRNLALAADVAAEARDWPALVRCVELHRSAYTCFDEAQNTWHDYWATYLALFGPISLAERLLFDGRPTQPRRDGLYACALIDDAGGTAPWREYLEQGDEAGGAESSSSSDTSDPDGGLTDDEREVLHEIHGQLRLGDRSDVVRRLLRYLRRCGNEFKPLFIRRIAARLTRMESAELVERIARRAEPTRPGGPRMTARAAAAVRLGIAEERARSGNTVAAVDVATRALAGADTPELAIACVGYGAPGELATRVAVDPGSLAIAVGPDDFLHSAGNVRTWVASVRLVATDTARGMPSVGAETRRVNGIGWYRCWLRYVLALAGADAARRAGRESDVTGAFAELTSDVHPFRGKPRACDLWSIRRVIQETIAWGLSLLRTEAEWRNALAALATASEGTGSRLDREDGGPLPTGTLVDVLMPYAADPMGGALVREAIEQHVARQDAIGTYYPTHADYAMRLARARHAGGDSAGALQAWERGAVFLAAYGWRKDITVFDIIESAPALVAVSRAVALRALADAQPLANAVVAHTDGRSTNHAPNAWLRGVLEVDPAAGIAVLARTICEEDGPGGWPNVRAVREVAEQVRDAGDPALIDSLLATLIFDAEHQDTAAEEAEARLAPVLKLAATDRELAIEALRRVAAEVSGDGRHYRDVAAARVMEVAIERGLPIPRIASTVAAVAVERPARGSSRPNSHLPSLRIPPFPPDPSMVGLLAGLRAVGASRRWDDADAWDDVVLSLSYHVGLLVDAGREDDARRLLRFFARDASVAPSGKEHPLGKLAVALDSAGYGRVAAMAYALAYTATRGGGGWLQMGDRAHGHLIVRAVALDAALAHQVVADEVAYALRGTWYNAGVSRHLIEQIAAWGEPDKAEKAWREAFAVVAHRAPLAPGDGWFSRLDAGTEPALTPAWSVDEALVALLLAKLSDPRLALKLSALAGIVRAVERRPAAVSSPLRWWLTRDAHVTSVLLVMDVLDQVEAEPFLITERLDDVLRGYAACDLWGLRRLASRLLARASRPEVPSVGDCEGTVAEGSEPSPERQAQLLHADRGDVLDDLTSIWPDLPARAARRLQIRYSKGDYKERATSRYRLAHGRDGKSYPPTPTLLWEDELFQGALHEALCGLNEHLWASGQWEQGLEDAVLQRVLPNTRLHLGLAASRTARPPWPPAVDMADGIGALPTLADDDPLYAGWTRLAVVERQYVVDPSRPYSKPVEAVTALAGAVAVPLGVSIPAGAVPFRDGTVDDWWWPEAPPASFPPQLPPGPVVRLTRWTDWLGEALVLIPPPEFHSYFDLEPAEYARPIMWADRDGAPAIALRTWRVRNPEALFAQPVACEGADLLVRPDLFERLSRMYRVSLRELRVVWRRPIVDGPDDE